MSSSPQQTPLIVALIQMRMDDDPQRNLQAATERADEAAKRGATLICLPELFRSRYFCQAEDPLNFELAETIPGPSTDALQRVAQAHRVTILAPLFEKRSKGIYHNSVVVIGQTGQLIGVYRKMHIPDDPGFYEKFYFAPGDLGFKVFETAVGRVSPLICWDQWFPEAARIAALRDADILVYPTAIGWLPSDKTAEGPKQRDAWKTIQRAHAIANGVFVLSVNRVGFEQPYSAGPGIEFWGSSFVCDPFGEIINEASMEAEEILFATIDLNRIERTRRSWPFLRDRRIDDYQDLLRRYGDKTWN